MQNLLLWKKVYKNSFINHLPLLFIYFVKTLFNVETESYRQEMQKAKNDS